MDSFFTVFSINSILPHSEPETVPEPSTPIDADGSGGGSGGYCIIA